MNWERQRSVGPFGFGEPISRYLDGFGLERVEGPPDATGWTTFNYDGDECQVHTEDGFVVSIACYRSFVVGGREMIGLPLAEAQTVLGSEPSEFGEPLWSSDEWQIPVEFDDICLQVWVTKAPPQTVRAIFATQG